MKLTLLLFVLLIVKSAVGFVPTKTITNSELKWQRSNLNIQIDPTVLNQSSLTITSELLTQIIDEKFLEASQFTNINVNTYISTQSAVVGTVNTIKFESDVGYFGSGVLAVTSVNHSATSGEIFSADILINDSLYNQNKFSAQKSATGSSQVYIGDVLTHEIGHFLGLGHSDVPGSSMVYSVTKDQHNFKSDDLSGLDYLYGNSTKLGTGVISGKVVGGNHIGVFGSQVQAISQKTGEIITSVLSKENGDFSLKNLNITDSYLIYILPPKGVSHLPEYYASVQTKYCNGNSYVPSFFSKCGGREKGKPQAINLMRSSIVEVGEVTIKCDEGLDPNYLLTKVRDPREIHNIELDSGVQTFSGYFGKEEIENNLLNLSDTFKIDLSEYDSTYTVEIKILTEKIGSNIGIQANLNSAAGTIGASPLYNSLGKLETDLYLQKNLSNISDDNIFEFVLNPYAVSSNDSKSIFGNLETMTNANATYLVIISLIRQDGSDTEEIYKDSYPYGDNFSCLESNITVETRANTPFTSSESSPRGDVEQQSLSCGTIDIDNNGNGPGGMGSFLFGLILSLGFAVFQKKSNDSFV